MENQKYSVATNKGGISNRVKCLISMWRFGDLYGRKVSLEWPENHTCGCKFNELFENDIKEFDNKFLSNLKKEDIELFGDSVISKRNTPKKYLVTGTWRFLLTPKEFEKYPHFQEMHYLKERGIDFNFKNVPEDIKKEILKYLKKLKPLKSLQKEINNFQKKYRMKNLVGIHIRRGDFSDRIHSPGKVSSDGLFVKKMNEILEKDLKTKFFLCTDSEETEKSFEEKFPGKIVKFPKKSFVRTNVRATQEGLIDLLLLSKTKKILGTYRSTFSEMAWWFGNCKPEIEIVIDREREREFTKNVKKMKRRILPKVKRIILILMGKKYI